MKEFRRYLLTMNLQHFSDNPDDKDGDNPTPPGADNPDDKKPTDDQRIPYDRFKKKVDEANELKRKLEEIEKQRDDAERKKLEEQNEFKALYEKTQAELETIRNEAQVTKLDALKTELLVGAGYTGEQLERVKKYVNGNDEETLKTSLEELKADIPPQKQYGDPSPHNPSKKDPAPKDATDIGRSIYQRLKEKGKIRR